MNRVKTIRKISLILAGAILLLHTVLPHEHHSELDEAEHVTQHETATGWLDFIMLAFHLDQGEGHLEKYQVPSSNILFHTLPSEALVFQFTPFILIKTSFPVSSPVESFYSRFLSSQLRFRGPPKLA
ncbi:MAG: hypothetical protein JXQ96_09615 [Cyclobacteriaceae bacterium]